MIDRVALFETSSGDFWAMSMPFENDEANRAGDHQLRSLLVNKLSAARRLGDFVRGLWSSAESPETQPEAGPEIPAGSLPLPDVALAAGACRRRI